MKTYVEYINANEKVIRLLIYKSNRKRWKIKIGHYNMTLKSYDCLIYVGLRTTISQAKELFLEHYKWYIKHTEDKADILLGENETYLFGKRVSIDEFNNSLLDAVKHVNEMFNKRMNDFGVKNVKLSFGNFKTIWGSYNKNMNLVKLNSKLLMVDEDLIDSVICHELTHIFYMNHSKDFYDYLGQYYPNYKMARKRLKSYSCFL